MAQADCRDESGSVISNLQSCSGDTHPGGHLISKIQTMKKMRKQPLPGFSLSADRVQDTGGLEESCDLLSQPLDCNPPLDMSLALRSVAVMRTLDLKPLPKLFAVPSDAPTEDNWALSPVNPEEEGAADPSEDEVLTVSFQSKYIHFFPLYQDYCLQVIDDLHRLKGFMSELFTPRSQQSLQSSPGPHCRSEAASPQSTPPQAPPSSPQRHPVLTVTPCTLWQDLDEVKASGLLGDMTPREIRLQESMFELIGSEASYLRSLQVAVNHFYMSTALRQTLSRTEHHVLFSNIRRVTAASEKFLMDLEIRLAQSVLISQVGDVVLQHCPAFRSLYVPYVSNMMYQEAVINQLLQQNREFLGSVRKLESDPVCQRQSLKSFLVLPFQRITRIKLILESILKLTEPGSDCILNLKQAIEAIHEIATECDKRVQKMKQIEELVCLEMLIDFGKVKSVPLIVSGRFLVRQGPMRQLTVDATYNSRVSFISIYLHLFNDLLIISSKKDQRFTVVEHAEFPAHVHVEHLKTELLGLPPDSFLLHLSQSQSGQPTAMILVTHTRSDKEAWMKSLSEQ